MYVVLIIFIIGCVVVGDTILRLINELITMINK